MDKDFMQYVYKRCERAIVEDNLSSEITDNLIKAREENNAELEDELNDQLQERAEALCYMKGYQDAIKLFCNFSVS